MPLEVSKQLRFPDFPIRPKGRWHGEVFKAFIMTIVMIISGIYRTLIEESLPASLQLCVYFLQILLFQQLLCFKLLFQQNPAMEGYRHAFSLTKAEVKAATPPGT